MKDAHLSWRKNTKGKLRLNEGESAKNAEIWVLDYCSGTPLSMHYQNNPAVLPSCQLGWSDFGRAQNRSSMWDNLRKKKNQQCFQNIHL